MWPVTCNFRLIYFYFDWIKLYWASTACKKMLGKENWFEPQYKHFPGVRTSLVAQRVKPPPTVQETRVWSLGWEDLLETGMATHCSILAHPTPRPPHTQKKRELKEIFWRRQWQPTPVLLNGKSHGQRSLVGCSPWGREESDPTEQLYITFHFHALEKEMATHSSVLVWRIPGTEESGGLPSMGSYRVGHDWSDLAAAAETHIWLPRWC